MTSAPGPTPEPHLAPDRMLPNPGGLLAIEHIRYRDGFIDGLWKVLKLRSVRIESERRGGKTSVLRRMKAKPLENWLAVYQDVSQVQTPTEFADRLVRDLKPVRGFWNKTLNGLAGAFQLLSSFKAFGFEFGFSRAGSWKAKTENIIRHVLARQPNRKLVLLFDELPTMIKNIADKKPDGPKGAMEILDLLQTLRKTDPVGHRLRMVFAGSVGLHHVLRALQAEGHVNQSVNDMDPVPLPPLGKADATSLARELIVNSGLNAPDLATVCDTIASATGGFPYFVHSVVDRMGKEDRPVTPATVAEVVHQFLTDPLDPWSLNWFLSRIDSYYPDEGPAVRAVLDRLAVSDAPVPLADLVAAAKGAELTADRAPALIGRLALDHYVTQTPDGPYVFQFPILRRWWRLKRGL